MLYVLFWLAFLKRILRRRIEENELNHVQNADPKVVEPAYKQSEKEDQRKVIEEDKISIVDIDAVECEAPGYEFELDETLRHFEEDQNEEICSDETAAPDVDITIPNMQYNTKINHTPKTKVKPNTTTTVNVNVQQPKMKIRVNANPQPAEGRVHSIVVKGGKDTEAYTKVQHAVPQLIRNEDEGPNEVVVEEDFSMVQVNPDESTPYEEDNALCDEISTYTYTTNENGPAIKGKPANAFIPIQNLPSGDYNDTCVTETSRLTVSGEPGQPSRYRSVSPSICIQPENKVHDSHGGVCLKPK